MTHHSLLNHSHMSLFYYLIFFFFFFFNDTAPTEISPLPLHAALPISGTATIARRSPLGLTARRVTLVSPAMAKSATSDRKSTRLNSSHSQISYAVFCLKKKKSTKNSIGS